MGRVSTFADPEVLKLTQTDFVPVSTDDWYTRRRQDFEGEFFRKVADQSPRKGLNGATRQGIYVFTADGELLAFKNNGGDAEDMKAVGAGSADAAAYERLSVSPFYNAQLRTTCVATMVTAGHAENALPQSASALVNCRILPHDDPVAVEAEVMRLAGPKVEAKAQLPPKASPPSPLRPDVMGAVEGLTQQMWPGVPVIPAMSTGATDSLFLRNIGIPVYGVSGLFVEPSDYRAHGLDERVLQSSLYRSREFLYQLVKRLAD